MSESNTAAKSSTAPITYDPQYILMVNDLKKYFPIKGGMVSRTVGYVKARDVPFCVFREKKPAGRCSLTEKKFMISHPGRCEVCEPKCRLFSRIPFPAFPPVCL